MDDELIGADELDGALRRSLAPGVRPGASTDHAWDELAPRLRRARRRHRAAIAGGALVVILGVSAAAIATGPAEQRGQVIVPAGRPGRSTTSTSVRTTTSTTAPIGATSTTVAVGPTVPTTGTAPGEAPVDTGTAPPPIPADETRSYTAPGGNVTVRVAGGALTLLDSIANPGYAAEVTKAEPDDVEVRFHPSSGRDSRIRVRIEGGSVRSETE